MWAVVVCIGAFFLSALIFISLVILTDIPDMFRKLKCEWTGGNWNYLSDECHD